MYVGRGVKPSPANPVAHQSLEDQQLFRTSIRSRARPMLILRKPFRFKLMPLLLSQAPHSLCYESTRKVT